MQRGLFVIEKNHILSNFFCNQALWILCPITNVNRRKYEIASELAEPMLAIEVFYSVFSQIYYFFWDDAGDGVCMYIVVTQAHSLDKKYTLCNYIHKEMISMCYEY